MSAVTGGHPVAAVTEGGAAISAPPSPCRDRIAAALCIPHCVHTVPR